MTSRFVLLLPGPVGIMGRSKEGIGISLGLALLVSSWANSIMEKIDSNEKEDQGCLV